MFTSGALPPRQAHSWCARYCSNFHHAEPRLNGDGAVQLMRSVWGAALHFERDFWEKFPKDKGFSNARAWQQRQEAGRASERGTKTAKFTVGGIHSEKAP